MSKRQDKIKERQAAQYNFLGARRQRQMAVFAAGVEMGRTLLKENDHLISSEDKVVLEAELAENEKIIADYVGEVKDAKSEPETSGLPITESSSELPS
jgi:hypothetical protein